MASQYLRKHPGLSQAALEHCARPSASSPCLPGYRPSCRKPETHADVTGGFWYHSLWRQSNYQQQARQHEGRLWTDSLMHPHSSPELWEPPAGSSGFFSEGTERTGRAARTPPDLPVPPGPPVTTGEGWGSGPLSTKEFGPTWAKMPELQREGTESFKIQTALRFGPISSFDRFL